MTQTQRTTPLVLLALIVVATFILGSIAGLFGIDGGVWVSEYFGAVYGGDSDGTINPSDLLKMAWFGFFWIPGGLAVGAFFVARNLFGRLPATELLAFAIAVTIGYLVGAIAFFLVS